MCDDVDGDAISGEYDPDFEEFAGLCRPDEHCQRMVALVAELIGVVNHGMLDLLHGVAALQRTRRDSHIPTLVANSRYCN